MSDVFGNDGTPWLALGVESPNPAEVVSKKESDVPLGGTVLENDPVLDEIPEIPSVSEEVLPKLPPEAEGLSLGGLVDRVGEIDILIAKLNLEAKSQTDKLQAEQDLIKVYLKHQMSSLKLRGVIGEHCKVEVETKQILSAPVESLKEFLKNNPSSPLWEIIKFSEKGKDFESFLEKEYDRYAVATISKKSGGSFVDETSPMLKVSKVTKEVVRIRKVK